MWYLYIYNQQREIWVCLTVLTVGYARSSRSTHAIEKKGRPKLYQFVDHHVQLYVYIYISNMKGPRYTPTYLSSEPLLASMRNKNVNIQYPHVFIWN